MSERGTCCDGDPPGSHRFLMSGLDFGERGPQRGEWLQTCVLGLLPFPHREGTGSAGSSPPPAVGWPGCCLGGFGDLLPFITKGVDTAGEHVSERISVCLLRGTSSLTEPIVCLHTVRGVQTPHPSGLGLQAIQYVFSKLMFGHFFPFC